MSDVDAALAEMRRAITDLGFRGVEMFTDINGKPLDTPELLPLFEQMHTFGLPILLHPRRTNTTADYAGEERSKFLVYTNFGWPFETSLAMARLAFGGVFERFPNLTIITHHELGARLYRETIPAVQAMPIDDASREKILSGNARRLFRLT